jgi:hypothetical protein
MKAQQKTIIEAIKRTRKHLMTECKRGSLLSHYVGKYRDGGGNEYLDNERQLLQKLEGMLDHD